ncbi:hypothetical protein SALBM135S_08182 [Streptomyces alboniger]
MPIAASSCQGRLQPGLDSARAASAFLYASRTVEGRPASDSLPPFDGAPVGGTGLRRDGRSVIRASRRSRIPAGEGVSAAPAAVPSRGTSVTPGACDAASAATAAAATALVTAPLRSRLPNTGA